jgi:hypothetical protein
VTNGIEKAKSIAYVINGIEQADFNNARTKVRTKGPRRSIMLINKQVNKRRRKCLTSKVDRVPVNVTEKLFLLKIGGRR